MIFSVSKTSLLNKLLLAAPILPSRAANPIYECIMLELKENDLSIVVSDNSITQISKLKVNNVEDGVVVVQGKKFINIVKSFPETNITFKLENKVLKIVADKIKFELTITEDIESFPKPPSSITSSSIKIDSLSTSELDEIVKSLKK